MNSKPLFYDDPNILYLNSGTQSKPPIDLIEKANEYRMLGYKNPVELHLLFPEKLYQAQLKFAQYIDCKPEDLFFANNVTESLNHFILGTKLPENAEVFIPDFEYGATINICKAKCDSEKRKLHLLPLSQMYLQDSLEIETINKKIIDFFSDLELPSSSLVILSHVLTGNGAILPVEEIAKIIRSKNAFLVVDGAHALGAFPLSLNEQSPISFYGGNLHKWMMGLPGTGFGWINPLHSEHYILNSQLIGWPNYDNAAHLGPFKLSGPAKKFYLKGTIDFAKFMAIPDLLDFWNKQGQENIFQKRYVFRKMLREGLEKNTSLSLFPVDLRVSPLLAFHLSDQFKSRGYQIANELYQQHHLIVATPQYNEETVLRLSPNIYNSEEEIQKVIEILNQYFSE